jgi:hypothetical protein
MTLRPIHLIDSAATKLAALEVAPVNDHFEGTIAVERLPSNLRSLFQEFEEVIEGQMFSLLDGIEDQIRAAGLHVLYENGLKAPITDLQVYPSTGAVSFKAAQPVAQELNGAPAAETGVRPI